MTATTATASHLDLGLTATALKRRDAAKRGWAVKVG